jgi:hypothetical protein
VVAPPAPRRISRPAAKAWSGLAATARRGAVLSMHGEIKVGKWLPFTASQLLTPEGFVWAARAGRRPNRIRGFDRYSGGTGEMRWYLMGTIPVMRAAGDDVTRSAAGRHAGELVTLLPRTDDLPGVRWRRVDDREAVATVAVGAFSHDVTVRRDERGRLRSVVLDRWGNPDRSGYARHPFGVELEGELAVGDDLVPASVRAGWWYGTARWEEGEFFRATLDRVEPVTAS